MKKIDVDQGSYEWHCLRQGKVTGTTLKSALGTPKVQDTLLYKLVSERMTEPQIEEINSKAVARGVELEPVARKAIIERSGIEFVETGMLVSEDYENFVISPDAIAEDEGVIIGGLEIKCPDSKKHIEYLLKDELPKEYLEQVMAPFIMSNTVEWWLFASFDDRNYETPLFMKMVFREDFKSIDTDRKKLKGFLNRVEDAHTEITF